VTTGPDVVISHSPNISKSGNWSGYAETAGGYTSVTGSWVVPKSKSTTGFKVAAQWIGIDGANDSDLIQTGTQVEDDNGSISYGAWWEILPAAETPINEPVSPGQTITASIIKQSSGKWLITISNGSWTFKTTKSYSGPEKSVEWIDEAPEFGGSIVAIDDTTNVTFQKATVNGSNPELKSKDAIELVQGGKVKESPSAVAGGDSFTMAYGSVAPPPPAGA
jgi:hypothetical protein